MLTLIILIALLGLVIILRSGLRSPQQVIYVQTTLAEPHHQPGGCALLALLAISGLLLLALLG